MTRKHSCNYDGRLHLRSAQIALALLLALVGGAITRQSRREVDAFCGGLLCSPAVHQPMTQSALSFIKDDVMDDINDEHKFQEVAGAMDSDEHFDNCHFSGGAAEINANYQAAIGFADPTSFKPFDITDEFGQILHAAQGFYAHSTLVDVGQTTLIEAGGGSWDPLTPYSVYDGVMLVEGEDEHPSGFTLSRTGRVVTVGTPDGSFPGIISGTLGPADNCPDSVAMPHGSSDNQPHADEVNKDVPGEIGHEAAHDLAFAQARHEFYRLVQLVFDRHGSAAVTMLLDAWVKPNQASLDELSALLVENDVVPPSITCPPTITIDANASDGAHGVDAGVASADNVVVADRRGQPSVDDPRQDFYSFGSTDLIWTARDGSNLPGRGPQEASCKLYPNRDRGRSAGRR